MSVLLAFGLLSACGNSDDIPDTNNHSEKEETGTIEKSSGQMVDFQLQNEDGMECYDFKEGENIIFRLEIKNDTDEDAILPIKTKVLRWNSLIPEGMTKPMRQLLAVLQRLVSQILLLLQLQKRMESTVEL